MKGLIFLSIFWTDLVKTIPVDDTNMYRTFLSTESKLKPCSNYNVSLLESETFKGLCSLPSPSIEDYAQSKDKIIQAMKFNIAPLLCYTIFHNVYAVCHPDTKISAQPDLKTAKSSDKFCESIPPISLPETCTEWLEDDDHTSKADCFLVNEVVGAVLNNQDFCENKCLVPDPNVDSLPSINPLCERLLETSNILVQMSPKDGPEVKPVSPSSGSIEIQPPPGLKKVTESAKVEKNKEEEEEKKNGPESKSGEEFVDSAVNVTEKATVTKPNSTRAQVAVEPSSIIKTKVAVTTVRPDNPAVASTNSEVKDHNRSSNNATVKTYAKANIKGDLTPPQGIKEDTKDEGGKEEMSKPVGKGIDSNGDVDAEPLVSNEEKNKPDTVIEDVKDEEETVKEVTESKVEPVIPKAEKEIVETKYENNMKPGTEMDEPSSFFGYFILLSIVAIIAYLVFHNKQKILALVLEGRRRQGNRRRSGGREYRKLDSNLEDTMDPGKETSLRQVIY